MSRPAPPFRAVPLLCPVCRRRLRTGHGALTCAEGHAFDLARDGHVTLTAGRALPGDTPSMVAA